MLITTCRYCEAGLAHESCVGSSLEAADVVESSPPPLPLQHTHVWEARTFMTATMAVEDCACGARRRVRLGEKGQMLEVLDLNRRWVGIAQRDARGYEGIEWQVEDGIGRSSVETSLVVCRQGYSPMNPWTSKEGEQYVTT